MSDLFKLAAITHRDSRLYYDAPVIGFAQVCQPEVWVFASPDCGSARLTQYTFGEPLRLFRINGDWIFVQSLRDDYCGWLKGCHIKQMNQVSSAHSHSTRFTAPITASPDLKSQPIGILPPDAVFSPDNKVDDYQHIPDLGWVHQSHIMRQREQVDPIITAHELLGKSYVWGGRSSAGLDCSALTQLCYRRAGWSIPRDADLQAHYLHAYHCPIQLNDVQAADLIFVPGHVMIVTDSENIIHASGYHMRVVKEPLIDALTRIRITLKPEHHIRAYRYLPTTKQPNLS